MKIPNTENIQKKITAILPRKDSAKGQQETQGSGSFPDLGFIAQENDKALAALGHVNLILTGRSGAGKSTLINTMFRKEMAESGVGLPVTQETACYTAPDMPLRVYDTKGIELGADAQSQVISEIHDLIKAGSKADSKDQAIDAIWYCVNTGTNRIEPKELEWIRELSAYNRVGLIVVLTQCFRKESADQLKEVVEAELGKQVKCIRILAQSDPYDKKKKAFGLDKLMNATMDMMPDEKKKLALINAQGISIKLKEDAARAKIPQFARNALLAGAVSDATLIGNEIVMCVHLTHVFGIDLDRHYITEILTTLSGVVIATVGGRAASSAAAGAISKHIPGVGIVAGVVNSATAVAITAAFGHTYVSVLSMIAKGEVKEEDLQSERFKLKVRGIFGKEYQEAKHMFKKERVEPVQNAAKKLFKRTGKKKKADLPEEDA